MKERVISMTTKFTFVEKTLGLLAGAVFAWFAITSVFVLSFGVLSKSIFVIFLYLYAIIALPIALLTCMISGHIMWGIADLFKYQSKLSFFTLGFLNGCILLFLFVFYTGDSSRLSSELLIYALVCGFIGGLTGLVAKRQAEAFQS